MTFILYIVNMSNIENDKKVESPEDFEADTLGSHITGFKGNIQEILEISDRLFEKIEKLFADFKSHLLHIGESTNAELTNNQIREEYEEWESLPPSSEEKIRIWHVFTSLIMTPLEIGEYIWDLVKNRKNK